VPEGGKKNIVMKRNREDAVSNQRLIHKKLKLLDSPKH
jgi:hypothetical protein